MSQVRVDVERSLHTFAGFLGDQERAERRQELERLLNAVVVKHEGALPCGVACGAHTAARVVRAEGPASSAWLFPRCAVREAGGDWQANVARLVLLPALNVSRPHVCGAVSFRALPCRHTNTPPQHHQPLTPPHHTGTVHYYQGLHDVASVLLLVAGEPAAFGMLCRLSTGHLRDATRASLDPVIELLGLMAPIVAAADAELAEFLARQGLPPFYALSWFLTWFSHDLVQFGEVCGVVLVADGGGWRQCCLCVC